jgi:hypothetical protein
MVSSENKNVACCMVCLESQGTPSDHHAGILEFLTWPSHMNGIGFRLHQHLEWQLYRFLLYQYTISVDMFRDAFSSLRQNISPFERWYWCGMCIPIEYHSWSRRHQRHILIFIMDHMLILDASNTRDHSVSCFLKSGVIFFLEEPRFLGVSYLTPDAFTAR